MMYMRNWCASGKFKNAKSPFIMGNVQADNQHEALDALIKIRNNIVPLPEEAVEYFDAIPGMLVFTPE